MPHTVLVTRPLREAERTVNELTARGHHALVAPLQQVHTHMAAATLLTEALTQSPAGVLITSANGIRAFAALHTSRSLPIWTVGDYTANVATELGFTEVISAGRDAETLAALVRAHHGNSPQKLLYITSQHPAQDMAALLAPLPVLTITGYYTTPVSCLPASAHDALRQNHMDDVLLYSQETARIFLHLLAAEALIDYCKNVRAIAISANVAVALHGAPWKEIRIAMHPTQQAMLACVG